MLFLPKEVETVITTLQGAGYSPYLVGGCVREMLRGKAPSDYDMTSDALPQEVLRLFGEWAHPTVLQHGTVTVVSGGLPIELTTMRRDGAYRDNRHPDSVTFGTSIEEDLARRDFTVNAIALSPDGTLVDPYGGQEDLKAGVLTEKEAQELIDHMVMKFRMVKFARIASYNQLFSGDPVWATLEVAGMGMDGRSMVTKNDYRFLHTLENMGPSPEPNLTVLYSERLPETFKKYAAHISVTTSSIQYENDDVMRPVWGDDYSICCCVSATETGKEMQFFGARANLAKCLLYAINGGIDEKNKVQVGPAYQPITSEYLDYDEVMEKYDQMMEWLSKLYVDTLNMIHYMHDKYYYEAAQMSLIDTDVKRSFATGIAGFSHVVDSLSAIKYAKVKVVRDEDGLATDFEIEGDFPRYGNDDDRADEIAVWLLKKI